MVVLMRRSHRIFKDKFIVNANFIRGLFGDLDEDGDADDEANDYFLSNVFVFSLFVHAQFMCIKSHITDGQTTSDT